MWLDYAPKAALWDHIPAKILFRVLVENSLEIPGKQFETLLSIAKKTGVYIVIGVHELKGGTLYNTIVYIDRNGNDFKIHRKLVPTYTERLIWGRGDGSMLDVLQTEYGNIGSLVCWEHWMPLLRAAMHTQNEVLHVAQWPAVKPLHQIASQHYAFEGQCFVLAAGCILTRGNVIEGYQSLPNADPQGLELLESIPGDNSDLLLNGGSAAIAPNSEFIVEPLFDKPGIVYSEINLDLITEGRLVMDTDGHYSRPDIFKLKVNTDAQFNVDFSESK